ncbi:MAG: FliM/FliN family flagellar motor C-terminal domain-containing protein [Phycisphaerae bacterium]|nr:FliM/FliN family flagellar motor C-terminal domain-containing protein [Phycisphaerae bacterium]
MDLGREKLINLMNRMRSQVPPEPPAADCSEVSWTVPHRFGAAAMKRMTDFADVLAGFMQRTLHFLCGSDVEVKPAAVTEHYASVLAEQIDHDSSNHYFLPLLMPGKKPVGFVGLPFETCTRLIAQTLRDPEGQIGEEDRLSALEKSILEDIFSAVTDSLCEGFSVYGEIVLEKADTMVHGRWPLPFQQLEDMCQISFQAGDTETRLDISLYLLDEVVDSIAGVPTVRTTPQERQKMPEQVIECMADAVMETSVWLCPSMMAFQDILTLEKGDFVLLDHSITTPLDVQVNGQVCFKAWPAQSAGRGAIVVIGQDTNP